MRRRGERKRGSDHQVEERVNEREEEGEKEKRRRGERRRGSDHQAEERVNEREEEEEGNISTRQKVAGSLIFGLGLMMAYKSVNDKTGSES